MKTGGKGILAFIVLLSLTSIFLTSLVAAQSFTDTALTKITSFFTDWADGEHFSLAVAKWMLLFVVTMITFGVLKLVPIIKDYSGRWRAVIAFIIAFLGTAFITPADIYTMLTGYTAMSMIFGAIIPFALLVFLSIEMRKSPGTAGILLSYMLWIGFVGFLGWKIYDGKATGKITEIMSYIYYAIIGLSVVAMLLMRWIEKGLRRTGISTDRDALMLTAANQKAIDDANAQRILNDRMRQAQGNP